MASEQAVLRWKLYEQQQILERLPNHPDCVYDRLNYEAAESAHHQCRQIRARIDELECSQGQWVCGRCGGPRDRCSLGQHGWPFVFCYNCQTNVELKWVTAS
jgi:hypothetical protein